MKYKRVLINSFIILLLCLVMSIPVFAMSNPNSISFGNDDLYQVFYNVKETGDWFVAAEGYVYYALATYQNLAVTGAGVQTNLSPTAGANWQCVSDGSDVTYVYTTSTSYITDLYTLADSTKTGAITSVSLYFRISNNSTSFTTYCLPVFYINGNYYEGDYQTATGGWSTKSQVFTTNPATNSAWTWNDINAMQIGINMLTSSATSRARCSAVYAVVNYVMDNPGYNASEAFSLSLLNTTGNVTLASTPLQSYGDRPISLYLSAAQVTALGLHVGTAYGISISGNPLLFVSPSGNNVTAYLTPSDYTNQNLGVDGGVPENNNLRNFCLEIAKNMEAEDNLVGTYITTVQGHKYLTIIGGNLFIEGMPNLNQICPILFSAGTSPMNGDIPSANGTYAGMLTPLSQWGVTTSNGLTMLGEFLGVNQALAGSVVLFILSALLAFVFYSKTQSGIAVLLIVGTTPFLGAWLGLMPLALAFIFTIVIVVLMTFFFFSRGAL